MTALGRLVFGVLLCAGGLGCADVDDRSDGGAADGPTSRGDAVETASSWCSVTQALRLDPQPADVLLLLDRSESMGIAFAAGTRYDAVASVLSDTVSKYAGFVRFGYQELPGRQDCEQPGLATCCASPPVVPIADDNAQPVLAAIAAATPLEGSSPTAAALQAAATYYARLDDGIDRRYVLLATDGAPDCSPGTLTAGGALGDAACTEALAAVTALVSQGVRVMVLGIGPDFTVDTTGAALCLDALAHAGGAAASPGSPGYYAAADANGLALAIEQLFGGVTRPSCVLRFNDEVDPSTVALFLDGQQIPYTPGSTLGSGWRFDTSQHPPVARVTGSYCDAIQSFQVKTVEARFDCHVCVDILECQPGAADAGPLPPPIP